MWSKDEFFTDNSKLLTYAVGCKTNKKSIHCDQVFTKVTSIISSSQNLITGSLSISNSDGGQEPCINMYEDKEMPVKWTLESYGMIRDIVNPSSYQIEFEYPLIEDSILSSEEPNKSFFYWAPLSPKDCSAIISSANSNYIARIQDMNSTNSTYQPSYKLPPIVTTKEVYKYSFPILAEAEHAAIEDQDCPYIALEYVRTAQSQRISQPGARKMLNIEENILPHSRVLLTYALRELDKYLGQKWISELSTAARKTLSSGNVNELLTCSSNGFKKQEALLDIQSIVISEPRLDRYLHSLKLLVSQLPDSYSTNATPEILKSFSDDVDTYSYTEIHQKSIFPADYPILSALTVYSYTSGKDLWHKYEPDIDFHVTAEIFYLYTSLFASGRLSDCNLLITTYLEASKLCTESVSKDSDSNLITEPHESNTNQFDISDIYHNFKPLSKTNSLPLYLTLESELFSKEDLIEYQRKALSDIGNQGEINFDSERTAWEFTLSEQNNYTLNTSYFSKPSLYNVDRLSQNLCLKTRTDNTWSSFVISTLLFFNKPCSGHFSKLLELCYEHGILKSLNESINNMTYDQIVSCFTLSNSDIQDHIHLYGDSDRPGYISTSPLLNTFYRTLGLILCKTRNLKGIFKNSEGMKLIATSLAMIGNLPSYRLLKLTNCSDKVTLFDDVFRLIANMKIGITKYDLLNLNSNVQSIPNFTSTQKFAALKHFFISVYYFILVTKIPSQKYESQIIDEPLCLNKCDVGPRSIALAYAMENSFKEALLLLGSILENTDHSSGIVPRCYINTLMTEDEQNMSIPPLGSLTALYFRAFLTDHQFVAIPPCPINDDLSEGGIDFIRETLRLIQYVIMNYIRVLTAAGIMKPRDSYLRRFITSKTLLAAAKDHYKEISCGVMLSKPIGVKPEIAASWTLRINFTTLLNFAFPRGALCTTTGQCEVTGSSSGMNFTLIFGSVTDAQDFIHIVSLHREFLEATRIYELLNENTMILNSENSTLQAKIRRQSMIIFVLVGILIAALASSLNQVNLV